MALAAFQPLGPQSCPQNLCSNDRGFLPSPRRALLGGCGAKFNFNIFFKGHSNLFFCYALGRFWPLEGDLYRLPVYCASCCNPYPARVCGVVPEVMHKVIPKICGVRGVTGSERAPERAAPSKDQTLPNPARRAAVGPARPVRAGAPEVIHKINSRESAPGAASRLCWRPRTPELGR